MNEHCCGVDGHVRWPNKCPNFNGLLICLNCSYVRTQHRSAAHPATLRCPRMDKNGEPQVFRSVALELTTDDDGSEEMSDDD